MTKLDLTKGKIIVTGGAGFIGSAIIWALNRRGIDNILVSDFLGNDDKFKNLVPLKFADYVEADELAKLIEGNDSCLREVKAIFHLGACSSTTEKDARYLIHNNYDYTRKLAKWSIEHGVGFVYASSAATYGDGSQGMKDTDPLEPLRPLNMYGYSKHLFDLYAQQQQWLTRICGVKYFNVFGPNEGHKGDMRSVVHKAYEQIKGTGRVSLFKSYHPDFRDGEQMRDFLYVKDAVAMTLFLMENGCTGIYNLGSGKAHTWLDLVHPIFEALNLPAAIDFIPMPESLRAKYQYFTQADISKLRSVGYTKEITPLASAVTDYVKNYLAVGRYLGDE
ncbi:MAG: ADP-glyceromanno-heptose 6-epimerase [Verrucomicrobia bacterium GWC2_42_7]|nr:MAG: ADP-glyceromanno-heptose 6-epimerase [Verrucomicrobia bacterium GWC2_42_7]